MDIKIKQCQQQMDECTEKLYSGVVEFINDLLHALPNEAIILVAKFYLETQVEKPKVMKKFIKKVLPVSELVEVKNETFFLNGEYVDSILSDYKVDLDFRSIWKKLSPENQASIWDWFVSFIDTTKQYVKYDKTIKSITALKMNKA